LLAIPRVTHILALPCCHPICCRRCCC
jgi:hypothetical protein